MRAAGLASLFLFTFACGSPSTSTQASAARTGQTSTNFTFDLRSSAANVSAASAARTASWITCSGAIGAADPVAVVQLHSAADTGELVMRDYVDPRNPRTACQFHTQQAGHGYGVAQLIDAHHVVIASNDCCQLFAVVDLPEVRFHWFQLPRPAGFRCDSIGSSCRARQASRGGCWLSLPGSMRSHGRATMTRQAATEGSISRPRRGTRL